MEHALVYSNYKRNNKDEVLVLDAGDGKEAHLHPGMNALPAELWDGAKTGERAKQLLAQGVIVDKGVAPAAPADDAEPAAGAVTVTVNASPGMTAEDVAKAVSKAIAAPPPGGDKQ